MATVYLSIGSNLGDRIKNMDAALEEINASVGRIERMSKIYETEPWGFDCPNWFLNMAIRIKTHFDPLGLLAKLKETEKHLKRQPKTTEGYQSRTIDLDIIFYDNKIIELDVLTIPHKHMHKRNFVLFPMSDIAPDFIHPVLKKTIRELTENCKDETKIKRYDTITEREV